MWLCIDQGGHSSRAAAFDGDGQMVAQCSVPIDTIKREPYFVEHEPTAVLRSVERCIHGVAERLDDRIDELECAGLATQRSSLVCAARLGGDALTPLISWQDRRGGEDLARFEAAATQIKRITGLRLSPHYGAGKLRWCLRNVSSVRRHGELGDLIAAPLSSYLCHHLCGEPTWSVDPCNASRTLLMDVGTAAWSPALLSLFEIPEDSLPTIRPCRYDFGVVRVGARHLPLRIVTGDQSAALFCQGEPVPGNASVNIGTGAFVQAVTGNAPVFDSALLSSIVWQDARRCLYALEGTVNGAAGAVDEMSKVVGEPLDPASPAMLAAFARIADAPYFLNGVSGLGSPDWIADFSSRFEGSGDNAARLAAVYESVGFLIVRNLDRIRGLQSLTGLTVSGGLAHVDWLAQNLADMSGLPVLRPADTEATLAGLAYLTSDGRCRASREGDHFEPGPNRLAVKRYARWTALMDAAVAP